MKYAGVDTSAYYLFSVKNMVSYLLRLSFYNDPNCSD